MTLSTDAMKRAAAESAIDYVTSDCAIGVGTGSTVAYFVAALGRRHERPVAAVATSEGTAMLLERAGIRVVTLSELDALAVYVDGADEIDPDGRMIKGAGGAHTVEKIVASAARMFVCIADESKSVETLGVRAPLPLEVVPVAARVVAKRIAEMGGLAVLRQGVVTDSGNPLLDVTGLDFGDPVALELALDAIPGVIECGLFARRRADVALIGMRDGTTRTVKFRAASRSSG